MLLVIDNYDSFTYNLVQYLGELGAEVLVFRNDAAGCDDLLARAPAGVVISPGPGEPGDAGISVEMVHACAGRGLPLLGVCLGHQAIGTAFGGQVVRAAAVRHGKVSTVQHDGRGVFRGLRAPLEVGRYHSLVVYDIGLPDELEVVARAVDDGTIMGLRHRRFPIHGVQFHPESILTVSGRQILRSFLEC